jgi:predicted RNA-binding protein with PUA-like domain
MAKAKAPQYWLVKTEPQTYSIDRLAAEPNQTTFWDGVRNFQARNFLRQMRVGDRALIYHSSCDVPAVVGTAVVVTEAYPDFTARDPASGHYDPRATVENPIWDMVNLKHEQTFENPVTLQQLRTQKRLAGLELLRRGSRLSVMPVSKGQFELILKLAGVK